MLSLFN